MKHIVICADGMEFTVETSAQQYFAYLSGDCAKVQRGILKSYFMIGAWVVIMIT